MISGSKSKSTTITSFYDDDDDDDVHQYRGTVKWPLIKYSLLFATLKHAAYTACCYAACNKKHKFA